MANEKEVQVKESIFPEITNLDFNNTFKSLVVQSPEHSKMLETIKASLPEVQRASKLFYKTQSQFMDNMLTVSHPTPIRNLRQILAEMNKTREALKEAHFKSLRKEVKIKIKNKKLELEKDDLKRQLLEIDILELYSQLESTKGYISGAIRKLTNYTEQYNSIIAEYDLKDFNEVDFEKEEERYHVMKAFEQGITAARSRGGTIDEGNMIYLTQIGVNGASAQKHVYEYLAKEGKMIVNKQEPTHEMFLIFLNEMADKYTGCSKKYAEHKGMTGKVSETASLQKVEIISLPKEE